MSNTFYEMLLRTQNGTNRVRHNVQSGLSGDYSITYPNIAPLDRRSLRFNSTTGFFEWVESPSTDTRFEISTTEPTNRTDGMIWFEPNNQNLANYWEWDASNSLWWSEPKLHRFTYQLDTSKNLLVNGGYNHNSTVRRHIFLRAGFHFQVFVGNDANNYFNFFIRTYNNVGSITNIYSGNSLTFTQNNTTGATYRSSTSLSSLNVSGSGRLRFVDNLFGFDSFMLLVAGNADRQPYGELTLLYRHERRATF